MKKTWSAKSGLSNPLPSGKSESKKKPEMVRRVGAIPILTRFFANRSIKAREKSINKIGNKIEQLVTTERQKIEETIRKAEKTDLHKVVVEARALRDKLEDVACMKPKFRDEGDDGEGFDAGLSKEEVEKLKKECAAAANQATGMNWDSSRGHFSTKDPAKLAIARKWQDTFEKCGDEKGI